MFNRDITKATPINETTTIARISMYLQDSLFLSHGNNPHVESFPDSGDEDLGLFDGSVAS